MATKPSVYWTDNKVDWTGVEALEVNGVRGNDQDGYDATFGDAIPEFWSVYVRRDDGLAECIADRATHRQARGYADALSRARGVPVNDRSNII